MLHNDKHLNTFYEKYEKDLRTCCFDDRESPYGNQFKSIKITLQKYQANIIQNQELIKGKTILDIGSATGMWAVLMVLNGATKVT
jgi:predicted nicotinamide N-methyase